MPDGVCKAFQSFNWVRTFEKLKYLFYVFFSAGIFGKPEYELTGTPCAAQSVGKSSWLWTARKQVNNRSKSYHALVAVSVVSSHFLQVYRSYYDNPSGTPYAVGAAGSPDYVQEYIVEKFEADCNQVEISEIFQLFL